MAAGEDPHCFHRRCSRQERTTSPLFHVNTPGLAHIFHAGFITPKQKFWCAEAETSPPWTVEYNYTDVTVYPGNMTPKEDKKHLGYCVPGCTNYEFDHDFWVSTMVTEWDLVCDRSWLKTLAKLLLFTGFALGSFCSGLVSDRYGRKVAIWVSSVTMVLFGVVTSFVPW